MVCPPYLTGKQCALGLQKAQDGQKTEENVLFSARRLLPRSVLIGKAMGIRATLDIVHSCGPAHNRLYRRERLLHGVVER